MSYRNICILLILCFFSATSRGEDSSETASEINIVDSGSDHMVRVTGIGGIFIKAKDPATLQSWYKKHLGIDVQVWGGASFRWVDGSGKPYAGTTAWMIGDGENFSPSESPFMVNYRVADLGVLLTALRNEGCNVLEKTEESEYGKFGWVIDPEGNKIELWEPPAGE